MMTFSPSHAVLAIFAIALVFLASIIAVVWHQSQVVGVAKWKASQYGSNFDAGWRKALRHLQRSKLKGLYYLAWIWIKWKSRTWFGRFDLAIVGSFGAVCIVIFGYDYLGAAVTLIKLVTAFIGLLTSIVELVKEVLF